MTRRRTCPKTRNNKTARASPLRMVRSSGEQLQGGKQRREEGAVRYHRAPSRRSLEKSSTKELLKTVKSSNRREDRGARANYDHTGCSERRAPHIFFWRFGKTRNVSFSIGRSERRSTKLTAGETAERQNCFFTSDGGKDRTPFFLAVGKTANKRRFTDGLAAGAKRRHLWQAWKASRGCNTPLFVKVSSFSSLLTQIDAKHLAHVPGSIPGLAAIYFKQKGEKECWII